jgi:hypothetical protein
MKSSTDGRWVQIDFDCLPLRAAMGMKIPDEASPKLVQKLERIQAAVVQHGAMNSYYLHNAQCCYFLTNDPTLGMLQFEFEGVVLTDQQDLKARSCDLQVNLVRDTCSWINQAIVNWLAETVQRSVLVEFDRYIQAGDLNQTLARLEAMQKANEQSGGFVGMYL